MTTSTEREKIHPRRIVFDGTINAGHVLTVITMIAAVAVAWSTMDKRVAILESERLGQVRRDDAQDAMIKDGIVELKSMVRDVQRTIDSVRDRQRETQKTN